jgi:hypothetical protein
MSGAEPERLSSGDAVAAALGATWAQLASALQVGWTLQWPATGLRERPLRGGAGASGPTLHMCSS